MPIVTKQTVNNCECKQMYLVIPVLKKSPFPIPCNLTLSNDIINIFSLTFAFCFSFQGQCSAGTLPVAWIDEGPGPPRCPPPCKASKSNSKNSSPKANNIDNTKYNMENRLNDKQQCLDYLGDNEELSPAQICKNSSQRSIETKLRALRLRHCCERTVGSALHNAALEAVLGGGSDCERMLGDLLETDSLAARITCEFTEVLVRYDCGQPYSIIHHCEDCRVSEREAFSVSRYR